MLQARISKEDVFVAYVGDKESHDLFNSFGGHFKFERVSDTPRFVIGVIDIVDLFGLL